MPHLTHPPADAQQKLTWFAVRFERWSELGEGLGLEPGHLEDLSGAMGTAAVAYMECEERPSSAASSRFARAVEGLDAAGGAALDAIASHAAADPAAMEVLRRAMLLEEGAGASEL